MRRCDEATGVAAGGRRARTEGAEPGRRWGGDRGDGAEEDIEGAVARSGLRINPVPSSTISGHSRSHRGMIEILTFCHMLSSGWGGWEGEKKPDFQTLNTFSPKP
jgi:hypothetical protein